MSSLGLLHHFILYILILGAHCSLGGPTVTIQDTNASYVGTTVEEVEHFLCIKLVHDTSGPRRFATPDAYILQANTQIDATASGPACPQIKTAIAPSFAENPSISEDCLHLCIARPAGVGVGVEAGKKSKVHVVVWIHGGGVVRGSAYDPHLDPLQTVHFIYSAW